MDPRIIIAIVITAILVFAIIGYYIHSMAAPAGAPPTAPPTPPPVFTPSTTIIAPPPPPPPAPQLSTKPLITTIPFDTNVKYQGCWTDDASRLIPTESPYNMKVLDCQLYAALAGYNVIGLQDADPTTNTGQCFMGKSSQYNKIGGAGSCTKASDGTNDMMGGAWSNAVYTMSPTGTVPQMNPKYIGCYNDQNGTRAMPHFGGITTVNQCAYIANQNKSNYFGLQNAQNYPSGTGECWYGSDYSIYGTNSGGCPQVDNDGNLLGSAHVNAVYSI